MRGIDEMHSSPAVQGVLLNDVIVGAESAVPRGGRSGGRPISDATMLTDPTTISVLAVLFLATVIRSAFGFGEALVAVPLLALIIPVEVAAPVAVLVSVTVAGVVLVQDWREVHPGSAGRLISPPCSASRWACCC